MSEFTPNGIEIDRFPEIKQKLGDDVKLRFGEETLVDSPESIIGNLLDVIASAIDGQNGMIQGVVDSFNPAAATGVFLSNLVALNGLVRNEAVYSVCSVDCTAGTAATVIPAGSIVANEDGTQTWTTDIDLPLGAGETAAVSVTATEPGPVFAPVGTLTRIQTPVYSWESVTNPLSSTIGQTEETDAALRRRRDAAAMVTGASSTPAIYRNLLAIPSVESASVYVNATDAVDTYGNPPQSVWTIIKGGTDAEVAEVLAETVAGGIIFVGDQVVTYTDPMNGKEYEVKFSRPDEIPVQVRVIIKTDSTFPPDGIAEMTSALVEYFATEFGVGENVVRSRLYTPINAVPGHSVQSLELSRVGDPFATWDLSMEIFEQGILDSGDITIIIV